MLHGSAEENPRRRGGLLLRERLRPPFTEPTLVNSHSTRFEAVAAGGLISVAVGARPHGAAEAPWVFFGAVMD